VQIFSIKIDCDLEIKNYVENGELYTCTVKNLKISQKNVKISSIDGKHGDKKSNADVESFYIDEQKVKFLPTGVKDFFPRLKQLVASKSQLEEIERKSFEQMSTLEAVLLVDNKISAIPEDSFYDLTQLKSLFLSGNLLKSLPANLLINQKKLKDFAMRRNQIEIIPKGFFRNNLLLTYIRMNSNNLAHIDSADLFKMKNLKQIDLTENKCVSKNYNKIIQTDLKELRDKCSGKFADDKKTNQNLEKKKGKASQLKINLILFLVAMLTLMSRK
jgi:Leucine-rich repeat (LRR) protein